MKTSRFPQEMMCLTRLARLNDHFISLGSQYFPFILSPVLVSVCTSWQYCRIPSLVLMQLLEPEGSGSHLPLWTLMCMLSFPQNMAT